MEASFSITNPHNADIFNILGNSIFAFDFKDSVFWISDILNNSSKKITLDLPAASAYKISICKTMPLFAYISKDEASALIVDVQHAKVIRKFSIQNSKIECISLSDDGRSLIIGGKNGIVSRWDIQNQKLLDMPNAHKDFVLLAKESPDRRFLVSVGYDKTVLLFDRFKDQNGTFLLRASSSIKCARFFGDFLALGDIAGYIYIINLNAKFLLHRFETTYNQIIDIFHYKDDFLFFLNSAGFIGIVDFAKKIKLDNFMPQTKYRAFLLNKNELILASSKKIESYNLDSFKTHCENLINDDKIAQAYDFISENKFLQNEHFYTTLESRFQSDVILAIAFACTKNQNLSLEILHKYLNVKDKSTQISELIANIKGMSEFENLMENGLEVRAIPMAAKNPLIKELKSYKDFRARFSSIIIICTELLKKGKKDEANMLIIAYKKIPSNIAAIQEIFLYPQKVDDAINAIQNRNYRIYFMLKKMYKFVQYLPGANLIDEDAEKYYYAALEAFYSLEFNECKKIIVVLKNFKQYNDFALDLEIQIDNIASLLDKVGLSKDSPNGGGGRARMKGNGRKIANLKAIKQLYNFSL